mgnify:FL=1
MRGQTGLPLWAAGVLAGLFVPVVVPFELVFGDGVGALAAGGGVVIGLLIAVAATRWRWDALTTAVAALAGYLLLGGPVALRTTTIAGLLPTAQTLQLLVVQVGTVWKDMLTLTPPAAGYLGPSVLPWLVGLACGLASGLITLRTRHHVAGSLPIIAMGVVGVAWGLAGTRPAGWPVAAWFAALLVWWAWAGQRRRVGTGETILVGRRSVDESAGDSLTRTQGRTVALVYTRRRVVAAVLTLAVAGGIAIPLAAASPTFDDRTVLRDLVEPPLDVQEYASPLASFRHYTTDLERTPLVTVSGLPAGARVRFAVMDTYNGIVFGMSDPTTGQGRYDRAPERLATPPAGGGTTVEVTATGLIGPWLPSVGVPYHWTFTGTDAEQLAAGLHFNRWAQAALSTAMTGDASYTLQTVVAPTLSDGQLAGVATPPLSGTPDSNLPDGVAALALEVTGGEVTQLGRARAIERYLTKNGYFARDESPDARPGHHADRLARMLAAEEMVGDDEQYAVLMALMLHSLGLPARVVMGAYPTQDAGDGQSSLTGDDVRAWVEVPFEGAGWAVFDPTPPRDQVPQTRVPKPKSVPRQQVLQPPAPPEPPVELPPAVTDDPADDHRDDVLQIPWGILGAGLGGLILLLGPFAAIIWLKARRTRRRRTDSDPVAAVAGAWDEFVDHAVDAGATVPDSLTRREAALLLAGDPAALEASWEHSGVALPPVAGLARQADTASFAPEPIGPQQVANAWQQTAELESSLAVGVGRWTLLRRRLSLRSVRRRYRARRAAQRPGRRR